MKCTIYTPVAFTAQTPSMMQQTKIQQKQVLRKGPQAIESHDIHTKMVQDVQEKWGCSLTLFFARPGLLLAVQKMSSQQE